MTRRGLLALVTMLSGCVYYNGMYNTRHLAGAAWKSERQGRVYQASGLWGQVAVKAESVMARHPTSRWADEAAVLRGIALARLRQCDEAMSLLERSPKSGPRSEVGEEAALAQARCQMANGRLDAADFALVSVLSSRDRGRRAQARLEHARILRTRGSYDEAIRMLDGQSLPGAAEERLLSLAGAGRRSAALAAADSLLRRSDSTRVWDSLLVAVGDADPLVASSVLDVVLARAKVPAEKRSRWMLEDAMRLVTRDPARARARLEQTTRSGKGVRGAGEARFQLLRMDVAVARSAGDLRRRQAELRRLQREVGSSTDDAGLDAALSTVLTADTVSPGAPQGDLALFLAAETARDALAADTLAAALFKRAAQGWVESPYAPKALLAAARLDPSWSDTAQVLLSGRYALSPYVAVLRGGDDPGFSRLEDSLRAFASTARRTVGPREPGHLPRKQRPGLRDDDDEDRPNRRRAPLRRPGQTTPGARVQEAR